MKKSAELPVEGFWQLLSQLENITVVVLLLVLLGLGYLHVMLIKEYREDRKTLLDLLLRNTEALHELKVVIASISGRIL